MGSADHHQQQLLLQQLQVAMPVSFESVVLPSSPHKHVGLVVVDEVNGFCTVGAGNLVSFSHHHHHVGHVSGYTISISQSAQTEKNSWNSKISLRSWREFCKSWGWSFTAMEEWGFPVRSMDFWGHGLLLLFCFASWWVHDLIDCHSQFVRLVLRWWWMMMIV